MVDALIVGAGPAGLAAAACLKRAGGSYDMVEQADRVAPKWHRHYERLNLHTPKQHSALPYVRYPKQYPTYPSRLQMIDYFNEYAESFGIAPRFEETVREARLEGSDWVTTTDRGTYRTRALIVATGLNARPCTPEWPGQDAFGGSVMHSAAYRDGEPFRGRDVLVVGFGNSGGEIAIDLVEHGARVALCVRSPVNIMPRDVLGIPLVSITLRMRRLPTGALDAIAGPIQRLRIGDLSRYGLAKREYGPATQIVHTARIPLIDVGTIKLIKQGVIRVRPGIEKFTRDGVEFVDGSSGAFDTVVLATGYEPGLEFLKDVNVPRDTTRLPIRGAPGLAPGLHFMGFRVTSTGTLREIGLEAQNIAAALTEQATH